MKINVSELSKEKFAPYGSYLLIDDLEAKQEQIGYDADQLVCLFENSNMVGIGVLSLEKRPFQFDFAECHAQTEEIIGGFDQDVLFHTALPTVDKPKPQDFMIFRLPAHGYVRFKRGVWHHAPFPTQSRKAFGIVLLPPFTYSHDSVEIKLDEVVQINFEN